MSSSTCVAPSRSDEMSSIDPCDLLTPDELDERLKVHKSWVYEKTRRRSRDRLPVMRIGRYMRFHWPEVVSWLHAHREHS
jgi:excisionase family DNA binding protein